MSNFLFADIILPIPIKGLFTYSIPQNYQNTIEVGMRVIVQFGAKKIYTGIIRKLHNTKPTTYKVKDISSILDQKPLVTNIHLKLWDWISSYYLASEGDVYKAAVPAGLKPESGTKIYLNKEFNDLDLLNNRELEIIKFLEHSKEVSINQINSKLNVTNAIHLIKKLLNHKAIEVEEKILSSYKAKNEKYIKINSLVSEERLNKIIDSLSKAPSQLKLLMNYISLSNVFIDETPCEIKKNELLKYSNSTSSTIKELIRKGIFEEYTKELSRITTDEIKTIELNKLNEVQTKALIEIKEQFTQKDTVLLHGVTSCGKTEIYTHLIKENIDNGKNVLYLLPEIALTSQIINRLKVFFGTNVYVYHSKFNDSERVEIWNKISNLNSDNPGIILGVRSSLFLPYKNLGLIIIDEEHENTYKQFDPSPRYNARDGAIVLASFFKAKTLLGTATPSLETYYNVLSKKYGLVQIFKRFKNIELPQIIISDLKDARRKKKMNSLFGPELYFSINEALKKDEQVILFQNRKGFSQFVQCPDCGDIPKCKHCDVSLTYYKHNDKLVCHYCGYTIDFNHNCCECNSNKVNTIGYGTEKIEEEVRSIFKTDKVARLDLESTRSKKAYDRILNDFESGKIKILIGTQMISKGLDFKNVSTVGIVNADTMLNFPDFRAFERSYQLITQVSGRAGRQKKQGKVVIQCNDVSNPIINFVLNNNFKSYIQSQLEERNLFAYPPFIKIISITLKHKNEYVLMEASHKLSKELIKIFGPRILGPTKPLIGKIQNKYLRNFTLKIEKKSSPAKAKWYLNDVLNKLLEEKRYSGVLVSFDVDPI